MEDHKSEHLKEIENIDVEYLQSGHKIFESSKCDFESNNSDDIKNHLTNHVTKKDKTKEKSREAKEAAKKAAKESGDWRDLYDNDGNPLYDSSESESSDT